MTPNYSFKGIIQDAGGGGAYVEVPFDVENAFGSKRPKVHAFIDGVPYRGTLTRMGTECHILGIRREIREQIGKTYGDEVNISLEPDNEPRKVEIPPELAEMFAGDPEAELEFGLLAYSHQREYVNLITAAKKHETRARRATQTVEMLKKHRKERV